jgi:hypothetical protein
MRATAFVVALFLSLAAATAVPRAEVAVEDSLQARGTTCGSCSGGYKVCIACTDKGNCVTDKVPC